MSSIESSEQMPDNKLLSSVTFRTIAAVIDCILIAVIDTCLMYAFWIIGMAMGILDARPAHWLDLASTIPLFLLDGLTSVAAPAAMIYMNLVGAYPAKTVNLANAFFICICTANWLYHAEFESSSTRGTPGKIAMDIAIVNSKDGGTIGFGSASLRHFAKCLSSLILFVGYLPIFGKHKQSLHDKVSDCSVLSDA